MEAQTKPVIHQVFCKDCQHHNDTAFKEARCASPNVPTTDLVRGTARTCHNARFDVTGCGVDAIHFEAKAADTGPAVIIYGPRGCGKTRNAAALAKHYGKTTIIDDWTFSDLLPANAICLTNDDALAGVAAHRPPYSRRASLVVQYDAAISALGETLSASASFPAAEEESQHPQQPAREWLAALPAWDGQERLQQLIDPSNPASSDAGPADIPQPTSSGPLLPRSI